MIRAGNLTVLAAVLGVAGLSTACPDGWGSASAQGNPQPAASSSGDCRPIETRAANASEQQPAFAGQTRACAVTSQTKPEVTVVARGLEHPWAVEPLPDGSLLVTERPGRLRLIGKDGATSEPIQGLPAVFAQGQGGLLDVALSPDVATSRRIYWSYSEPRKGGNATSVARGTLAADNRRLESVEVIFRAMPTYAGRMHFGSRLAFGPDGMLYVTLGERSDQKMRPQAQQMDSHMGKIIRITPDGQAPKDNPFVGHENARPEIWTLGHRNIQASAFDPEGRFWIVDHGPRGGDELNLIEKGKNYGWAPVTYGQEYSGKPIAGSVTAREGYEQPVYYWDPVIAPSGAEFYTGSAFPEWRGNLFVGGLITRGLVRLVLKNNRVTGEEHLLTDRGKRIRDVKQGPDGALYVVTDEDAGEVWRLSPAR
jgi:glucose/arabinose dehydrogenase